jgi:hypothetical protein
MKKLYLTFLTLYLSSIFLHSFAQNVMINVLTQNSGIAKVNQEIFFEVTISNTSPISSVPEFKIKPVISFPSSLVQVQDSGHILPKGWSIISNKNGTVTMTNGTDVIPEKGRRIILISIKGKTVGGQAPILGNITFSNGIFPGSENGTPLKGDNIADNSSASSIIIR